MTTESSTPMGAYPLCKSSWVGSPYDFCDEPATVPVVVACVHEHVRESHACPEHADDLPNHYCALCFHADGHRCPLSATVDSRREHAHG